VQFTHQFMKFRVAAVLTEFAKLKTGFQPKKFGLPGLKKNLEPWFDKIRFCLSCVHSKVRVMPTEQATYWVMLGNLELEIDWRYRYTFGKMHHSYSKSLPHSHCLESNKERQGFGHSVFQHATVFSLPWQLHQSCHPPPRLDSDLVGPGPRRKGPE